MKKYLDKIKTQENQLRKLLTNKKYKEHLTLCSCLDELGNSLIAIEDFSLNGIGGREGEQYLRLYGLAHAITNLHQIVLKFYEITDLKIAHNKYHKDIQEFVHYTLETIPCVDKEIVFSYRTITDEQLTITSTILKPERKEYNPIINYKQECYEHNQNTNINKIYEILNNSIPSNTYLTYFMVTNNGEIDIKGNTDKVENVYIFLKNLKDSLIGYQLKITQLDLFTYEASDLYEINRDNTINSYDYYTFEITNVNNKN